MIRVVLAIAIAIVGCGGAVAPIEVAPGYDDGGTDAGVDASDFPTPIEAPATGCAPLEGDRPGCLGVWWVCARDGDAKTIRGSSGCGTPERHPSALLTCCAIGGVP